MELKKRMAVTLPAGPEVAATVRRLQWAEENGYDDAWLSGSAAPDSMTLAAAVAHTTKSIRIGDAITPFYTRSPSIVAAQAYVLAQLLPERFVIGLGSSSQTIMENWNGIPLEKPVTRARETVQLLRSMLRGDKTDFDGETISSHGYRQPPLESPPPIYLAALRPRMVETAAGVGDGVILNLWPTGALPKIMEHVRIGAEKAGKDPASVEVVNRAMVLVTDDIEEARERFRAAFVPYFATPVYNKFLAWAGYEEVAEAVTAGWAARDRHATSAAFSDELIDEIAVIGTREQVQDRIREHADGGVHTHIIAPLAASEEELDRCFSAFSADNFSF